MCEDQDAMIDMLDIRSGVQHREHSKLGLWSLYYILLWWGKLCWIIQFVFFFFLLQMLNDQQIVDIEFFGNFSCSCKKMSFNDPLSWSLSTSNGQPLCSSSLRLSSPLQTSWTVTAVCACWPFLGQMCCWCCELPLLLYEPFWTHMRIVRICFLSNIISLV